MNFAIYLRTWKPKYVNAAADCRYTYKHELPKQKTVEIHISFGKNNGHLSQSLMAR